MAGILTLIVLKQIFVKYDGNFIYQFGKETKNAKRNFG